MPEVTAMGFRFFRRIKLAPGVTLNLSKSGGSLSFGRRGARYTVGPRGTRQTVGIPGTGLFYTTSSSGGAPGSKKKRSRNNRAPGSAPSTTELPLWPEDDSLPGLPEDRLTMGFFKRLVTPKEEQAFVDACRELVCGREQSALRQLGKATGADAAFLAGVLCLKKERYQDAVRHFSSALRAPAALGRLFAKYGVAPTVSLSITDEVTARVAPNTRGVLLALVEAYQAQNRWDRAIDCLQRLRRLEPDDPVVKLSVVELLMEAAPKGRKTCRRVLKLTDKVANDSPLHAALLLYKAKALRALGLGEAARKVLSVALRRRKDRPTELLLALRYERALLYEELGRAKQARADLERIYAEDSDYEDVADKLGLA
jgi:tetratricopeptide (TPR) repeat protein